MQQKKALLKWSTLIHKWAGLTVGIQVMLWIIGGLYMVIVPIEKVRGEHLRQQIPAAVMTQNTYDLDVLKRYLGDQSRELRSTSTENLNGKIIFRIRYAGGEQDIVDARTGLKLNPFGKEYIAELATRHYAGDSSKMTIMLTDETYPDIRPSTQVWRVDFNDNEGTRFYYLPDTGRLRAVRTDTWRIYDFMWMLHTMDYETRDNFNNPMVIIFTIASLIFGISGVILLFYRFTKRDFRWLGIK